MATTNWGVSTGEGHQITIGVTEAQARSVAQREADERGEPVAMWPVTGEEARDEDEVWVQPVTNAQIEALRDEATQAGDEEMRAIAERALAGDASERAECVRVIRDVQSRDDSGRYDD